MCSVPQKAKVRRTDMKSANAIRLGDCNLNAVIDMARSAEFKIVIVPDGMNGCI